ncbi:cell surface protein [Rhizobium sp. MC63]|uniref:Cell surface protein n=1 Tax=Rhizobium mulingense TaxID=3031128 RepID=A0ACC6MVA6_9HYPH|nr:MULTISPECIES: cell surface protein [unclassified Rhizobium]MDF0695489.1 cell surface protein [Rhizobium sp. MC63]MEA3517147.1 cell surface protein [Rhizobium sp. MJ31]
MKIFSLVPLNTALGTLVALATVVPAEAAPVPTLRPAIVSEGKAVQYKAHAGTWHGYRGFATERPGTRRHSDGYWYPLAAFGVEAGTTGSIIRQPVNRPAAPTMCNPTFSGSIGPGSMPCDNGY